MPEMQFEWGGLIRLLAQNLYSEKRVFIRELIQNAHDAILRRRDLESDFGGRIDVEADSSKLTLTVRDNGIGMNESDVRDYLATIGNGATRAQQNVPGLIGYFGIGFLSAFIVAEKVVVLTRKVDSSKGWQWENTGSRSYSLNEAILKAAGTTVCVHLRPTEQGLLDETEIVDVIRTYADMLRIPIHVNQKSIPTNSGTMPWERPEYDAARLQLEGRIYINETTGDDALEVIPIAHPSMSGILYITRTRVYGVNPPRAVRVFLKRMFVSENIPELLPDWASFVNGIVNSSELLPTAARDNVVRDEAFEGVNKFLGDLIIRHLDGLRKTDPERFTRIQEFHSLAIRAACGYFEPFFEKFIDLLEWRTAQDAANDGHSKRPVRLRTLPQIIEAIKVEQQGQRSLLVRCFASGAASSSQFVRVAAASGVVVIDASQPYELPLLTKYVQNLSRKMTISLLRVDREDDPVLFRSLGKDELPAVSALAHSVQQILSAQRFGDRRFDITVLARSFEPASLPALLKPGKGADSFEQAQRILEDPNAPLSYRNLAEDVIRKGEDVAMTLNANSPLVRKIAQSAVDGAGAERLAMGIYNSAFLSSGMMSEHNAAVLQDNLLYFIDSAVDARTELQQLRLQNASFAKDVDQLSRSEKSAEPEQNAVHTVFLMIPFSDDYGEVVRALRELVEDRWFMQLFLASDRKYEDRILDSVKAHLERADLFVADITDANPNVMFELGAVFGNRRGRPVVTLVGREGSRSDKRLPADLGGLIFVDYSSIRKAGPKALCDHLENEIQKDVQVRSLLQRVKGGKYMSPRRLGDYLRGLMGPKICEVLSNAFPSEQHWRNIAEAELRAILEPLGEGDAASLVLSRVKSRLVAK